VNGTVTDSAQQAVGPFLTPAQLAARHQTTTSSLRSRRYRGTGPRYFKDGPVILYRLADVEEYERSRMVEAFARA
jgi:hypothetical protein